MKNPLEILTLAEIETFQEAIDKNFMVYRDSSGEIKIDLFERWFDLHLECAKYVFRYSEIVTAGCLPASRSMSDVIKIMIINEKQLR